MLHYYLEKGIAPEYILSLPPINREFYLASAELTGEEIKEASQNGGERS